MSDSHHSTPPNGQIGIGRTAITNEAFESELLQCLLVGMTLREASGTMRASYWKIRKAAKQPVFLLKVKEHSGEIAQRMMDELVTSQVDMAKKLEEASQVALDEMMAMMADLDQPSKLKVNICQDILDRNPQSSRTKRMDLTGAMSHEFINPAVLIHAAATAKELEKFTTPQLKETNGDGSSDNSPNS